MFFENDIHIHLIHMHKIKIVIKKNWVHWNNQRKNTYK